MKYIYNDGGRSQYFKGSCGDCVTRAICNATGLDYKKVYDDLQHLENTMKVGKHETKGSARNGIRKKVDSYYIEKVLGWVKVTTCKPGSHERVHLTEDEMPKKGTYIVQISKHLTCIKDGVIYDTYNCSEKDYYDEDGCLQTNTERLVYKYWKAPSEEIIQERANQKAIEEQKKANKATYTNTLKESIKAVDLKYEKELNKLQKQIKKLQHQHKIIENRKKKEIEKIKTNLELEFNL